MAGHTLQIAGWRIADTLFADRAVDLLWLGGIGTYVKASTEKHEDAGDRSNDNVRVDAADLAARVVGEGANLGFTQKARIEYALRAGALIPMRLTIRPALIRPIMKSI